MSDDTSGDVPRDEGGPRGPSGAQGTGEVFDIPPPPPGEQAVGRSDSRHLKRITLIWFLLTAAIEPILWFVVWPYFPPGRLTSSAASDQWDTLVVSMIGAGAMAMVLVYGVYAVVVFRHKRGEPLVDGPPLRGHWRVQAGWVFVAACVVSGAFIFGTYELIIPNGAGSGEGPSPIWTPNAKTTAILPIQVIGQQWVWTYRYPTFGGMETTNLVIPNHTHIAFHVTSLDVVHDWWAYQLGIKADANPGEDNVAFTHTNRLGKITVRCDELCGIWHGAMYGYGHIVSQKAFVKWGDTLEKKLSPMTKLLPKFSWTYFPSANGAYPGPPYYPKNEDPFYKMYLYEYGKSGAEGNLPAVHVKKFEGIPGVSGSSGASGSSGKAS